MAELAVEGSDKPALIDDEDYEKLSKFKRYLLKRKHKNLRVVRYEKITSKKRVKRLLHREICNAAVGSIIDHIDNDVLNNCKANLRACTRTQNCYNRSLNIDNTSGYKGVVFHKTKGKFAAQIGFKSKSRHIGYYKTKEEAAKAYNEKAKELFGEFAKLNDV